MATTPFAGVHAGEINNAEVNPAPADGAVTVHPRGYLWYEYGGGAYTFTDCNEIYTIGTLTPDLHVAGISNAVYEDNIIIGTGSIEDDRIDQIWTTNEDEWYTANDGNLPPDITGIAQVFYPDCQWYNYSGPQLYSLLAGNTYDVANSVWLVGGGTGTKTTDQDGIDGVANKAGRLNDTGVGTAYIIQRYTYLSAFGPSQVPMTGRLIIRKQTGTSNFIRIILQNGSSPFAGVHAIFNPRTGDITQMAASTGTNMDVEVRPAGEWWDVYLQCNTDGASTRAVFTIYPAYNADGSETQDTNTTGYMDIGESGIYGGSTFGHPMTIGLFRGAGAGPSTATAAIVIDQSNIHMPAANHSDTQGGYYIEWRPMYEAADLSRDVEILSLNDAAGLLYYDYTNEKLKCFDGVNTAEIDLAIVATRKYRLGVIFGAGQMAVGVDAEWGTPVTYDGAFTGGADFTVCRNPEAVNLYRELRGYQIAYADAQAEIFALMIGDYGSIPYSPRMMTFDGATGYYNDTTFTTTGNKTTVVMRFNIASFNGDTRQRLLQIRGPVTSRFVVDVLSADFSTANYQGKIYFSVLNSAGAVIGRIISSVVVTDGQDHVCLFSYDADTGSPTMIVDAVDVDDPSHPDRLSNTGTMSSGSSSQIFLGASSVPSWYVDGKIGYFGVSNDYLTDHTPFMTVAGLPKNINESTWFEWGGNEPLLWHDEATMDIAHGSEAPLTKVGTITGPA
jgi:hypothetical protein